ncbi:MAG: YkgJ family cysteine cluster protein [Calditrichaeota bacterium]|nr:YkgJ family cysteine cluster protein [Calditrichota bacterium]
MEKIHRSGIRFECQSDCSDCCSMTGGYVYLSREEAKRIAAYLQTDESEFIEYFTREIDNRLALADAENDSCVFLEDNLCGIYPVRPLQCATFPFWAENLKSRSRWEATVQICPGIGRGRLYSYEEIERISKGEKSTDD